MAGPAKPDIDIRVEGLDELRAKLRAADKNLVRDLGKAGKAAADIVAKEARGRTPTRSGRAQKSVRAVTLRGGGAVKGGGSAVPYFGFVDYGNKPGSGAGVGRNDSQDALPYLAGGRIVYPALADKRSEVVGTYEDLLDDVLRSARLK